MAHAAFLLLLALVASLCVAQARGAVTATYEVVETPISYLPFYPPQYITAAVVNIVADEPVYVHGGLCMTNNVCAEKNIVPCCELSLCDSPTPPSDCACASQPNVQCIDENTPLDVTDDSYKTMSPTTIMYFEVTVNNSCHNMIFSQNGIRGDWSTVIGVASTAFEEILALSTHESSTYGNDDIVLCAAPFDGSEQLYQANLYNNLQYYESLRAADGFYRIRGAVQGSGSLRLTVSEITEPTGLVPLVDGTHLRYAQGIIAAECDGKMVPYAKFPPPYLPTFLPPTNDPLYDFTQYMGMLAPHPPAASLNRNQVSILFPLASDTYFTWTTIIGDIEKCKINLTMLRTANDTPIYDGVVYPVRSNITTCNRTDVAAMAAHHDALVANFTSTQVVTLANARIFGASGITGSVKFAQCKRFAQQYIVPVEFVVTNDTECYAQPGTDDFYFDPCCNVAAAWDASCTARRTIRSAYAPNNLLVADTCRTDACSNEVATALGTVTARLTSNSCARESLNNLVEVLDLFQAAQSGAQPGPCAGVFAFGTDEELVDCIVANIGEAYTQEFYTLWGVSAATAATTDFRTLLLQRYNKTGCQQAPFVAYYDTVSRTSIRNDSLDFDAAGCTSIATCNWFIGDQSLDSVTCTQSFRGPDMCASCDPASGACNEIGELMQCNAPYDVSFLQTAPDFCVNVLNGTFDFQVGLCRLAVADPTSNRISHLACVPPDLAAFQLGPDATFAFPLCLVDFLSATDCDCSNPTAANQDACSKLNPDGFADPAAILFYVDNSFVRSYYGNNAYPDHCVVAAPTFYEQCLEVTNAKYFPGRAFAPGYLSTQAACQGAGGRCTAYDDPLYDIFYTEAECAAEATQRGTCQLSNCIGCDKTTCENTIGCSDVALIASSDFGSTVTDFITRGSNLAFCLQSSATDPTLGCIYSRDVSRLSAGEATQQFADYKPIYVDNQENRNQESCESFGRCQEATFAPGITTPKNKSACLAAGGQYLQAFRWGNGTFIPDAAVDPTGGWVTGAWVPREYKPHFAYAPMINRTGFATDFYSIQAAQQARSANQTSLCKTAQLLGLLTSLACDCQSQADGCYTTPQLQLLLLARACANLADYFPFSGNKGSFTVQSAVSTFSPSCVDITAEVVPYTLFRRSSANVYTSVFLQAVTAGPYAVLDNNDGISVGTLYGDGIKVSVSQGTLTGVYDICLAVDQDQIRLADRFRTPDFATVDANFKSDTFRALNLNCTLDRVASQICCLGVSSSAGPFFFPVMRVADAEGVRFRDTLTRSQRNCFWAAVFFYLLIWIFLAFRLVNYVLFLILRPVKYEWTNLILLGLILTFLFLAFTLRWTYFLVTPLGKLVNVARVGDLIYGELPFYFFLTVFTVIVAWWIELYHWAMSARRTFLSRMRWVLLGVNVFLYAFFIAVIIAYAVTSRKTSASSSVCATSTDDRGARILSKVYKTIISVIAAILALGFIVYGTVLVRILTSSSTMQVRSVVQFTLIAVASAVGLLVQCAILLYTTYAGKVNTVAALVVLIVAEIIPGTILAVAMRQPATQKSAIKELIWCMLPPDASMGSSTTNSKFTSKKTSGSTGASSGSARASGPTQTSSSPASSAADSRF